MPQVKSRKKFNGKVFEYERFYLWKRQANAYAKRLRKRGKLARVIPYSKQNIYGRKYNLWLVYSRKGKD